MVYYPRDNATPRELAIAILHLKQPGRNKQLLNNRIQKLGYDPIHPEVFKSAAKLAAKKASDKFNQEIQNVLWNPNTGVLYKFLRLKYHER